MYNIHYFCQILTKTKLVLVYPLAVVIYADTVIIIAVPL